MHEDSEAFGGSNDVELFRSTKGSKRSSCTTCVQNTLAFLKKKRKNGKRRKNKQ